MELLPNDPRLGSLAEDGAIATWPQVDAFGQRYSVEDRVHLTKRQIGHGQFVVIPPDRDSADLAFTLAQPDLSVFTEPPVETTKRGK